MNQQNIQHSVSLEAILKISRTHSCKISSSVEQGQVQWSSEKVPFMELLLACFVMLLWGSLWLPPLHPFPPTKDRPVSVPQIFPFCSGISHVLRGGRAYLTPH